MRIKFNQDIPVKLNEVPKSAYGAIGIRSPKQVPRFIDARNEPRKPGEPIDMGRVVLETVGETSHYFRKGWTAELPDDIGQTYLDAGQAELVPSVVHMSADDFTKYNGLYSTEHEQLFIAGVILGYTPGSTPQNFQFQPGPNWDKWKSALDPDEAEKLSQRVEDDESDL